MQRQEILVAERGKPSWLSFGERLKELIADPPEGQLMLRIQMPGETRLTVSFEPEECSVIESGLIILKVLNHGIIDLVEAIGKVSEETEQVAWRLNDKEAGDELYVTEIAVVRMC